VRDGLRNAGVDQFEIQRRGIKNPGVTRQPLRLGLRSIVEATSTWWSNWRGLARRPAPVNDPPGTYQGSVS
jgi:hypothetical protein